MAAAQPGVATAVWDASAPAPASLEQRLDVILLQRIALGSVAMTWSLGLLTVAAAADGAWPTAAVSVAAQVAAAAAYFCIRSGRVPAVRAGPLSFLLWLMAEWAIHSAYSQYGHLTQEVWLALLLWAYGAMQLHTRWANAAFALGALTWATQVVLLDGPDRLMHGVSIAGSVAVAILSFGANRAVVHELEELRALDTQRAQELTRALETTRRELENRRVAEQEREHLREQFVAAQRMDAVGNLAGGLAHDMNNLLAAVLNVSQVMRRDAKGQAAEDLDIIIASARRGASLTRALLGFSRRAQYQKERLALGSVVDEAMAILRRTCPRGIVLADRQDRGVFVDADRGHLVQVLVNVCINAVQAMGESGRIDLVLERVVLAGADAAALELAPGEYAALSVSDTGPGMTEEVRAHAFEPFFTTKPVGAGSGLGLAMVWGTLKAHGGSARIEPAPGGGARVTCFLPAREAPAETATPPPPAAAAMRPMHILIVDDEAVMRRALGRVLTAAGHQVDFATDGADGVARLTAAPEDFQLVVLDMAMPRVGGAECYERMRQVRPSLPIVCVSGHALQDRDRALLDSDVVFLAKPFTPRDLDEAMARALGNNP
ncbi:MAG: response regulator [Deltaproteobacteria bacterium]|nr:response regulator [Deltaproteobacteria bacterium]